MGRDEFNHVEITNDKQIRGVEFGRTSTNEYFSQRENIVNKNELNHQVKDELNEGAPNASQKERQQEGLTREEIEELNSSSSSSSSTSSTASTTSSSAASSSSSGAAATASSGATAAAGSAAVSAGVVVVTAFTVVTATPIIVSNATAVLHSFESSINEVFYEIELVDTLETESYRVTLTSESYQDSKLLEPGINSGEFLNLKENTEYELTVEEGNEIEIKRTLLTKKFTTEEGYIPISEIRGLYFSKDINFLDKTFELKIDFIDEQDIYSDFTFTLANASLSQTFEVAKTTEVQTFTIASDFDLDDTYQYSFSYKENGTNIIYEENTFIFNDVSGAVSEFNYGLVDESANFLTGVINVTLDYQDDFNILSDFQLVIYNDEMGEENAKTYQLNKSLESQFVSLFNENTSFDLGNGSFTYYFAYNKKGIPATSDKRTVSFTDTSGAVSEFNSGTVDESANFLTGVINVTIDYIDDFGVLDDFKLVIYNDVMGVANAKTYTLEKTKESQSISVKAKRAGGSPSAVSTGLDLEEGPFNYYFTYTKKGFEVTTETKEITFVDTSGAVSTLNDGTVDSSADFLEETFNVTIDFVDDFGILDNITLVIYDIELGEENARSYVLSKVLTSQTLSAKAVDEEPALDLESGSFIYYFTYQRKGVTNKSSEKEVTFADFEGRTTAFNSGTIDPKADFMECEFYVQLDYVDEYNRLDDFVLHISNSSMGVGPSFSREYPLTKTTEVQTLSSEESGSNPAFDLESGSYEYYITYTNKGVDNSTLTETVTFSDKDDRVSIFNSVTINEANFYEQTFDVTLDFVDDFNRFSNFHIVLTDNTKSLTAEYDLDKVTTTQTFSAESIEDSDMILDLEHSSLSYVLTYEERGETQTISDDTTFTDKNGLTSGVTTFDFTKDGDSKVLMNYATYAFDINMDFEDYFGYMSDFQLEFYRIIDEEKVAFDVEVDRAGGDQHLRVVDAMGFSAFCDGEAVNYELTYLNPNSVRETAKSGTIAFADSSVSEITDLEVGELKYDGACYYLPFRIDYIDEKSIFEHFSVYVENEDVPETYLIQLTDDGNTFMDNYWQLCYFSIGDISALTGKTATVTIKDSDTDEVLFSKNFDLVVDLLDGDMEVMGLRIAPLVSAEMPYFTVRYFANNGSVETDPVSIKFVNSYGTEYVFEGIWIPSAGGSINVDVDSGVYASFISNVNSGYTFDVYVIYPGAGGEDVEVLCYAAFRFDVS